MRRNNLGLRYVIDFELLMPVNSMPQIAKANSADK
jgi:hypothetical protein